MKTFLLPCILLLFLVNAFPAQAQWEQTNGPYGYGPSYRLLVNGSDFYLLRGGLNNNFEVSSDNGFTWTIIHTPNIYDQVSALAFSDTILYLSQATMFYKSLDKGITWIPITNSIGNPSFSSVAAKDSLIFASGINGIYYSHNYGASWSLVNTGLPTGTHANNILIYNSNVILNSNNGIFYTNNYGNSWNSTSVTTSLSILKEGNGNLYAAGDGIYESSDGGITWASISNSTLTDISGLAINGTNVYACNVAHEGIYITTNNGATWAPYNPGLFDWSILDISSNSTGAVICLNSGGIYGLSGSKWVLYSNLGYKFTYGFALATNDSIVYSSAAPCGLFTTTDDGNTWTSIDSGMPPNSIISAIAARDNFVYAAAGIIYRSDNYGKFWSPINSGLTDTAINCLAVKNNSIITGTSDRGVYISMDNGDSWTQANTGLTDYHINSVGISGNEVFCATNNSGVFKSSLNNINWIPIDNGATKYLIYPADSPHVYAASSDSLFRSDDFGSSWTNINPQVSVVNLLPYFGGQNISVKDSLIFITGDYTPCYSSNYGRTWHIDTAGWIPDTVYSSVIKGNYIFAGTYASSVWRGTTSLISGLNPVLTKANNIKTYPNPFNDKVTFNLPEEMYGQKTTITIFDLLGKRVKKMETVSQRTIPIEFGNISSGLYFYKVQLSNENVYTGKIIRE